MNINFNNFNVGTGSVQGSGAVMPEPQTAKKEQTGFFAGHSVSIIDSSLTAEISPTVTDAVEKALNRHDFIGNLCSRAFHVG